MGHAWSVIRCFILCPAMQMWIVGDCCLITVSRYLVLQRVVVVVVRWQRWRHIVPISLLWFVRMHRRLAMWQRNFFMQSWRGACLSTGAQPMLARTLILLATLMWRIMQRRIYCLHGLRLWIRTMRRGLRWLPFLVWRLNVWMSVGPFFGHFVRRLWILSLLLLLLQPVLLLVLLKSRRKFPPTI